MAIPRVLPQRDDAPFSAIESGTRKDICGVFLMDDTNVCSVSEPERGDVRCFHVIAYRPRLI